MSVVNWVTSHLGVVSALVGGVAAGWAAAVMWVKRAVAKVEDEVKKL